MFLNIARSDGPLQICMAPKYTISDRRRFAWLRNTLFPVAAGFAMPEIHYFRSPQILQCPKYTISGRCRLAWPRNTLFLVAAGFATLEIHYFWPPQVLQCPKYTISGRRRLAWLRNTLFPPPLCAPEMEKRPPDTVSERSLFKENGRR